MKSSEHSLKQKRSNKSDSNHASVKQIQSKKDSAVKKVSHTINTPRDQNTME